MFNVVFICVCSLQELVSKPVYIVEETSRFDFLQGDVGVFVQVLYSNHSFMSGVILYTADFIISTDVERANHESSFCFEAIKIRFRADGRFPTKPFNDEIHINLNSDSLLLYLLIIQSLSPFKNILFQFEYVSTTILYISTKIIFSTYSKTLIQNSLNVLFTPLLTCVFVCFR